jgi:hypothetical protein
VNPEFVTAKVTLLRVTFPAASAATATSPILFSAVKLRPEIVVLGTVTVG